MTSKDQPRVLWLTNLPAPYRFPIWTRMAEFIDIKVAFLLGEKNWRNWNIPTEQKWKYIYLSLKSINIKEYDLIFSIRGARKLLENIDILILGGWETPFYIYTSFLAKKRNIPIIQFYESTSESHKFNNILVRKIRSMVISKAYLVVTLGMASTNAVKSMGIASKKIVTLFNPVDVSWFHSFANTHRVPEICGHKYIYVGQLIERKNIVPILSAFNAIREADDTLTIAGNGPLLKDLKNLTISLDLADAVTFVGHLNQEELASLYARSNTLILVSTNEVWGLVVNEGLASGLHIVVSNKCGVSEFVQDMKGAYICSVDQKSIEEAMSKSKLEWSGYIEKPDMLQFTPERFADEIVRLI